jgi:cytochrome oxidase Cu insertion factor (SCO1/SenC/PrrC family)
MRMAFAYTRILIGMVLMLSGVLIGAPLALALEVGEPAPDFTLPSSTGDSITLSQFRDKKHVLLQFYTMDFNPT